ncbi:MAG: phospholipid carrier-dependent glycosyltransferase [Candidatus Woesebacteria bacterium]|jgi:hypothetical protein
MNDWKRRIIFILIFCLAASFRLYKLNWDENQHLHPDERFLTMVSNETKIPKSLAVYFDPQTSTLNPRNMGYDFFVYGNFPLIINKIVAVKLNNDNYHQLTIQGRFLSAIADLLIVLLIYKTVALLEKKYKLDQTIKSWAAFIYAITVLPIQLSHFFATDTFLNLFVFASFYFALQFYLQKKRKSFILSAVFLSLGLASKITAIFILPLNLALILLAALDKKSLSLILIKQQLKEITKNSNKKRIIKTMSQNLSKLLVKIILYLVISYLILRLVDPYLFADKNLLNPKISPEFINNIKALKSWEGKDVFFPPAIQWINKKIVLFALTNLVFIGFGLPQFLLLLSGLVYLIKLIQNKKSGARIFFIIINWIFIFFLYQSIQFIKALRYFIILYPFMSFLAAIGANWLINRNFPKIQKEKKTLFLSLVLMIWPLMFMSIYIKQHPRIKASEWIYKNLDNQSLILNELWDDALPLLITNQEGKKFRGEMLAVFDPDSEEKWQKIKPLLEKADYYILSSNRAWGSIPTVPEKYHQTSKFYQQLFEEKLGYKKIAEFSSYPSLKYLGIPIEFNDDKVDETFTVYDHPKVMIFKNIRKKD